MPVRAERPGDGELAQLVADHRLGDEHRHVLAAVVHGNGVSDHFGDHGGPARPGLDDPLVATPVLVLDLRHQVLVDERTLLHGPGHRSAPPLSTAAHDLLVRGLGPARAAFLLPPWAGGMAASARLAFAAAQW